MRRVLMVAYFFPPTGGVSVARMLRPAEYLPRFGWEPIVIAPSSTAHVVQDAAMLSQVPLDTRVIRTICPEPEHLRRLLRKTGATAPDGVRPDVHRSRAVMGRRPSLASRASRWSRQIMFPDEQAAWMAFAIPASIYAAKAHRADAILSTSSPATSHLIAMVASRAVGIPWVADFRDPWVGNAGDAEAPRSIVSATRRLERRFISSAAEATFVTSALTALYQDRYPSFAHRMSTIPNGYVRGEPFEEIPGDREHFTIVYSGSLYRPAELSVFIGGLEAAVLGDGTLPQRLRVRFVGAMSDECRALLSWAMSRGPIAPIIEATGLVSREAALGHIRAADAALLLLPVGAGSEINASGKLYDYIGLDRQVLAVIPEGEAARTLRELDWGVLAEPSVPGVAHGLRTLLSAQLPARVADPERRYDWRRLTSLFAASLDRVTDAGGDRRT